MSPNSTIPFYFGGGDQPLFGCLHQPAPGAKRQCGVVLSSPFGHEYINSHRALRQLATLLATAGFPVLRFDYYGCGDSLGEECEASLSRWIEDTSAAISELQKRAGLGRVSMIGLRLGATIATAVAGRRQDIAGLVLWDPVTNGSKFLEETLLLQKQRMRFRHKPRTSQDVSTATTDFLGFALPSSLREGLAALDISRMLPLTPEKVLFIASDPQGKDRCLPQHLVGSAPYADFQSFMAPRIWEGTPEGTLLVPAQILRSIVSWMVDKNR